MILSYAKQTWLYATIINSNMQCKCVPCESCAVEWDDVIRELCGVKEDVVTKVEKRMLRWFGHGERMSESRLSKGIWKANVSGNAGRGRPRRTHIDLIG